MCKICPRCGAIAEFNAYYGRTTCTRCDWESEKIKEQQVGRYQLKYSKPPALKKAMYKV